MADSKAPDAAHEEQWVEVAPPAYQESAITASDDDLYYATPQHTGQETKTSQIKEDTSRNTETREQEEAAVWYKQAALSEAPRLPTKEPVEHESVTSHLPEERIPELPTRPSFDDEKLALQLQREEEAIAAESRTHSHVPDPHEAGHGLSYTFTWRRPLTDYPALTVSADDHTPNVSHWRLNYQSKYLARLHRYQADQARVDGDFPARQVAEIKFPEFILPGCGPMITFEPHEDAVYRKGSAYAGREEKFMKCSGWLTTRYALEVPVLGGERCVWRNADTPNDERIVNDQRQPLTTGDIMAQAKRYMNDETWTPYPGQHLVATSSSEVLATYTRAAPWTKDAGVLHIAHREGVQSLDEYVEGIIVATVAMVGMQDRMGLASSLMQASTESVMASRNIRQGDTRRRNGENMQSILSPVAAMEHVHFAEKGVIGSEGDYKAGRIERSLRRLSDHLAAKSVALLPPQYKEQRALMGEKV